jgi:hypothetical protein
MNKMMPHISHCFMRNLSIFLMVIAFTLLTSVENAGAFEKDYPFRPGEKLTYRALWGFIPAGEASIEVFPMTTVSDVDTYHFVMITKTNAGIELIYKIQERQDSYVDTGMNRTIMYKKLSTGKHPRDVVVTYDWNHLQATYTSFGKTMDPIHIVPGTVDPLSIFFVIRLYELEEQKVIELPVSDGKKCIMVKATVATRETITVRGQSYDTYCVVPDMERLEDVFKETDEPGLKIWFTADEKKLPVKIQNKVGVGSFIFELTSAHH